MYKDKLRGTPKEVTNWRLGFAVLGKLGTYGSVAAHT